MGRHDKLKVRFSECRGPFAWSDFQHLLAGLGYEMMDGGHSGGSRRKFVHGLTGHMIFLHEPHGDEMKPGMVRRLQDQLRERGLI